jgi:hypothetical protein
MSGVKKDCFAWNEKRWQCDVLDEIVCRHKEHCSFYMEKDKYKLKQAQAEINKLEHERVKATKTKNEMAKVFEHDDNLYKFKKL